MVLRRKIIGNSVVKSLKMPQHPIVKQIMKLMNLNIMDIRIPHFENNLEIDRGVGKELVIIFFNKIYENNGN